MHQQVYKVFLLVSSLLLTACVSTAPGGKQPSKRITLQKVQSDPDTFRGKDIVWGGRIVAVRNMQKSTRLEIIAYPLNRSRRPKGKSSTGRFIAVHDGYLESVDYIDRIITVEGQVNGTETSSSEDSDYQLPVVDIREIKLWKDSVAPRVHFNFGFVFRN